MSLQDVVRAIQDDMQEGKAYADEALSRKADIISLATVATSGSYLDLYNLPPLGSASAKDIEFFASAAQGALADSAIQP